MNNYYQDNIQSLQLSLFSAFRYSIRRGKVTDNCDEFSTSLDMILESEEDLARYGVNTELDAQDFVRELYGNLYGEAEETKDNEWSFAHNELSKIKEVNSLSKVCKGDPDLSIIATKHIMNKMGDNIADMIREYRSYSKMQEEMNSGCEDAASSTIPVPFALSLQMSSDLEGKGKELVTLIKELQESKELISFMASKHDSTDEVSEEKRIDLVKQLLDESSSLYKIMKIVGRLNDSITGLPANSTSEQLTDTKLGIGRGKFRDLVSKEKLMLATKDTQKIFFDRHIRRQQFKFDKKGKSKKSGGAITVLVDESGSMKGNREKIAKSVAAALLAIATNQNRDAYIIGFTSRIRYTLRRRKGDNFCELLDYDLNPLKKLSNMDAIGYVANRVTKGGTSFSVAIDHALKVSKGKNADILFITDGADQVPSNSIQRILKTKEKDGTRIFSILLSSKQRQLPTISEAVVSMTTLTDGSIESLAKLMKSMER